MILAFSVPLDLFFSLMVKTCYDFSRLLLLLLYSVQDIPIEFLCFR